MTRNLTVLFLHQAFVTFWMLTFVSMGFVLAWTLFQLQGQNVKRPRFNLKEL